MSSSGVWETGGDDFENTITVGISRAISAASCSGPDGIAVSVPSASLAKPISRSSKGIGGIDHRCFISTVQPNSSAARSHASSASFSIAASSPASRWRWSSSSSVRPATAVTTPGSLLAPPVVQ